jgi:Uma2 family endonuclease
MSLIRTLDQIEYPETDGQPMGETDLHIDWMIRLRDILRWRYRQRRVYVASNLLVYYEEGEPSKFVVPDSFVVLDCEPRRRRVFKIWEEGKTPDVVLEVTSRSTKREDQTYKPQVYGRIGVGEYFLYDPSAEYLDPPLQGFGLQGGIYQRIEADARGALLCQPLGITLRLEEGRLVMRDAGTDEVLRTEAEAKEAARQREKAAREAAEAARQREKAAREAAEAARQREKAAREAAELRGAELEAQLQRLREQLYGKNG